MSDGASSPGRINAIDAIRGICLLNIFINHITTGFLREMSPSRIMFSDSAEAFVFLAGISCFLAFGSEQKSHEHSDRIRMWRRARTLYIVNLLIAIGSVAILLIFSSFSAPADPTLFPAILIEKYGLGGYIWHILTMQQNVGYTVVLRLYVVLMLVGPFYIWLANIRFWLPMIPACLVWVAAGSLGLAETNSLTGVPMALTLLPWNFVFAGGIALGAAIVSRKPLPDYAILKWVAALFIFAGPICFVVLTRISPDVLAWVNSRNDHFWTGASKSLQSPLRVAYMFTLAYLFLALRNAPVVRIFHSISPQNPFAILGRKSLEVFAVGAVMALLANQILWTSFTHGALQAGSVAAILLEIGIFAVSAYLMLTIAKDPRWSAEQLVSTLLVPFHSLRQKEISPALEGPAKRL